MKKLNDERLDWIVDDRITVYLPFANEKRADIKKKYVKYDQMFKKLVLKE